jgi:methylglyoxal synthase
MNNAPRKLRIGLSANRKHQEGEDSALARLLRESCGVITDVLMPQFIVVGRTYDAIKQQRLLGEYDQIERFPYGRDGGLMKLVSRVVEPNPERSIDAVIYLIDPVDPSSSFPEAVALKRQCVIHGKPFLSTAAGASEWFELEAIALGAKANPILNNHFDFANEAIALIAHDSMKPQMLALAERHFPLLDKFAKRYATGTTGGLLNQLGSKLKNNSTDWVKPFLSGPLGGDAQIAELILDGHCNRVLFLEDPHVARQHEADIQLLERAARTRTFATSCVSDLRNADRWLTLLAERTGL